MRRSAAVQLARTYAGYVLAAMVAGVLTVSLSSAAAAVSAGQLVWQAPRLIDARATAQVGGLTGLACVSGSCVAAGGNDLDVSRHPASGDRAWATFAASMQTYPTALSCPSVSLCVGAGGGVIATSMDPFGSAHTWPTGLIAATLTGVSCPTVQLCVASGYYGTIAASTAPSAGASSWNTFTVPTTVPSGCGKEGAGQDCHADLVAISCPTAQFCAAVDSADNSQGDVLTSASPASGAAAWRFAGPVDQINGFQDISCPTTQLCAAVDFSGMVYTSIDPTATSPTWRMTVTPRPPGDQGRLPRITCPTASFCLQAAGPGIVSSTDPTAGRSAWKVTVIDPGYSLQRAACDAAGVCIAVDNAGRAILGLPTASVQTTLAHQLANSAAAIRTLVRTGHAAITLRLPADGTRTVSIRSQAGQRHLRLAAETVPLRTNRTAVLRLRLSSAGQRIVARKHRFELVTAATLNPAAGPAIDAKHRSIIHG